MKHNKSGPTLPIVKFLVINYPQRKKINILLLYILDINLYLHSMTL